jgi:hypothetical protein
MLEGVAASTRPEATGSGQTANTPEAKLKQACQDFEGIFMGLVVKQMRATVQHNGILPESFAQQTFEEMWTQEVVNNSTHASTLGLAEMLERSLAGASSAENAAAASQALGDTKGFSTLLAAVRAGGGGTLLSAGEGEEGVSSILSNLAAHKSLPAGPRHGRPAGLATPSEGNGTKTGTAGSGKPLSSAQTADAILGEIGTSPR